MDDPALDFSSSGHSPCGLFITLWTSIVTDVIAIQSD